MQNSSNSPFSKLYEPLKRVQAYLDRIGFAENPAPTLECLEKLIRCQLMTIPFENLDVYYGGLVPSLETDALFDKLILHRRGGYCFELNGLFLKLLQAIGFSCVASTARIMLGRDYIRPPVHEIIWVTIGEKRYFCDVGYGGPVPLSPLEMVFDKVQTDCSGNVYRFVRGALDAILEIKLDGVFQPLMMVSQTPCEPVDFLPLNTFCAVSADEPFRSGQMLHRRTPTGKCTISNNVLRIKDGVTETEIPLKTETELRQALRQWFGIDYGGSIWVE